MTSGPENMRIIERQLKELNRGVTALNNTLVDIGRIFKAHFPEPTDSIKDIRHLDGTSQGFDPAKILSESDLLVKEYGESKTTRHRVVIIDKLGKRHEIGTVEVRDTEMSIIMSEYIYNEIYDVMVREDIDHYVVELPEGDREIHFPGNPWVRNWPPHVKGFVLKPLPQASTSPPEDPQEGQVWVQD